MSFNSSVITGKCPGCIALKAQLRDRDEKLEAVGEQANNWSESRTGWACREDILHILKRGE